MMRSLIAGGREVRVVYSNAHPQACFPPCRMSAETHSRSGSKGVSADDHTAWLDSVRQQHHRERDGAPIIDVRYKKPSAQGIASVFEGCPRPTAIMVAKSRRPF